MKNNDNNIQYMPIGMCLGIGIGMAIGSIFDNISIGMCMGLGIGLCFGCCLDTLHRKKSKDESEENND